MTQPGRNKIEFRRAIPAAAGACLCLAAAACTPATGDAPAGTGGAGQTVPGSGGAPVSTATGGSGVGSGGADAGNSIGSGGAFGSGGSAAAGGSVGTGGLPGGGSGGKLAVATGGSNGAGGSAALGCNWIHNPDDTWVLGTPTPADKIVLFDGTTLNGWHKLNMPATPIDWKLLGDGTMQVVPSGTGQATEVQSNTKFDDVCVHVEYMTPVFASTTDVQKQGNSGVYLKSAYEMQILDTHNLGPLIDGCGAVYQVAPPLVVACNMYKVWNTYEIEFKSSVWSGTTRTKDAVFVRVALNGKLVQLNVDLALNPPVTKAGINDVPGPQPLGLQDHLDLVSFRNIWATIPHY